MSTMINFEEELKKFHPLMELDKAEDQIQDQDLDDMADVVLRMVKDAREEASRAARGRILPH